MGYVLKLYIAGKTSNSVRAIDNLKTALKQVKKKYKLEVIDILKNPKLAEDEKIIATPVLEKKLPPPLRRIIGDLADQEQILVGLDLIAEKEGKKWSRKEIKKMLKSQVF